MGRLDAKAALVTFGAADELANAVTFSDVQRSKLHRRHRIVCRRRFRPGVIVRLAMETLWLAQPPECMNMRQTAFRLTTDGPLRTRHHRRRRCADRDVGGSRACDPAEIGWDATLTQRGDAISPSVRHQRRRARLFRRSAHWATPVSPEAVSLLAARSAATFISEPDSSWAISLAGIGLP